MVEEEGRGETWEEERAWRRDERVREVKSVYWSGGGTGGLVGEGKGRLSI